MNAERVIVASSCIAAVRFSPDERVLVLEFRNGLVYEYFDVPSNLYTALITADSKGAFIGGISKRCGKVKGDVTIPSDLEVWDGLEPVPGKARRHEEGYAGAGHVVEGGIRGS